VLLQHKPQLLQHQDVLSSADAGSGLHMGTDLLSAWPNPRLLPAGIYQVCLCAKDCLSGWDQCGVQA